MKIIALPDLHNNRIGLLRIGNVLSKVDLVLLVGDLTNGEPIRDAIEVVQLVQRFNPSILAIPGNWDIPAVEEYLSQEKINLHRRHIQLDGLILIGMGLSLPGIVPTPNEITEAEFETFFTEVRADLEPDRPEILVCHQPPYNTRNDLAQGKIHVGSAAVRRFIEQQQPLICFTGHIHEGIGMDTIGRTKIVNPGPLSEGNYAYAEVGKDGIQTVEILPI
jgi:Icc-related predicted phosphoesterase